MAFNRDQLFAIAWRIAILVLPWQTRWMYSTTLGGWPWEQGTIAVYISWFPLLATIMFGWSLAKRSIHTRSFRVLGACSLAFIFASIGAIIFSDPDTRFIRSTVMLQWWIQCSILFSFAVVLWRSGLTASVFIDWCIVSMVPHIVLGIAQYFYQTSPAFTWLGLAQHIPSQLGTSVIEHDGLRILRVYGGFPHPNIFGGWLVFTIVLILRKVISTFETRKNIVYVIALIGCSMTLILTYSRSAWVAALIVLFFVALFSFQELRMSKNRRNAVYIAYTCIGVTVLSTALAQANHIFTRFDASARLETKSLSTRAQSIQNGITLFREKPLFGSGVHGALLDLSAYTKRSVLSEPAEPPHLAYLLLLAEFGLFGMLAFVLLCAYFLPRLTWSMPLLVIGIIALFDHYPVSLWAGQSLVMLCVLLAFLPYIQKLEEHSTV